MKLIEGMKRIKIIEKKMRHQSEDINKYATILSTDRPVFNSAEEQKKEIKSLLQSNEDLAKEYLSLKRRIELTNLKTQVTIGKETYTIADLLVYRRGLVDLIITSYSALNDKLSKDRLVQAQKQWGSSLGSDNKPIHVEYMYDESFRNENIRRLRDLKDEIEQRLEVINATTELLEE